MGTRVFNGEFVDIIESPDAKSAIEKVKQMHIASKILCVGVLIDNNILK